MDELPADTESTEDELALARDLRRKAPGSLDRLIELHADALFEFILFRVGHRTNHAEDLTQETLMTAIAKFDDFSGRSALRTWLFGIAKNKIRESRRDRGRERSLSEVVLDADDEVFATLGRIAEAPIPDEILERKETRAMVGATLASLPESYRVALTERYVEGRSVPETARRQGRGIKAAESTLHRARRAFGEVFSLLTQHATERPL